MPKSQMMKNYEINEIKKALRTGKLYGVNISEVQRQNLELKLERVKRIQKRQFHGRP